MNTISAQEHGKKITSPFGVARPSATLDSSSNDETFVDPETGEIGHIIHNPFGVANPDNVDTVIDNSDDAGEETGGIISSPFGSTSSNDSDTGEDAIDVGEKINLIGNSNETYIRDMEIENNGSDTAEFNDDPWKNAERINLPTIDNPIRGIEYPSINFNIVGTCERNSVTSTTNNPGEDETLFVPAGLDFTISVHLSDGYFSSNNPVWTLEADNINPTSQLGIPDITDISISAGTTYQLFQTNSQIKWGNYTLSVSSNDGNSIITRKIRIIIYTLRMTIENPFIPAGTQSPLYDSILVTNIADESSNGKKPDYANFNIRDNESSILHMNMEIDIGNHSNYKVKFEYEGVPSLTGLRSKTISDDELQYIYNRGANVYQNYTPYKVGKLRVWTSSKPHLIDEIWTTNSPINEFSARNPAKYGTESGNYFAPTNSLDGYALSDIFPEASSSFGLRNFYIEGINPNTSSSYAEIKATLGYNNSLGKWKEILSTTIKLHILEAKVILNNNNDPTYSLNEIDHKIKDQNSGFQGWYAEPINSSSVKTDKSSTYGFENTFPFKIESLPKLPNGMKYVLKLDSGHDGVILPHPTSLTRLDSILDHIKISPPDNWDDVIQHSSSSFMLTNHSTTKDVACLFGVYEPVNNQSNEQESTGHISLYLCHHNDQNMSHAHLIDRAKYTFCSIDKLFEMWSTRQTNLSAIFSYPTENSTIIQNHDMFYVYDYPTCLDGHTTSALEPRNSFAVDKNNRNVTFARREERDTTKDVFLFLHGFNVTEDEAIETNRIIFRRMYWSGYRGTYVGLTWNGDYNPLPWQGLESNDRQELVRKLYFDEDVFHAFQTSPAVCTFIKNDLMLSAHINIAAHSLGNLVMWEALRLLSFEDSPPQIQNVISIEGAVWSDAFRNASSLYYRNESDAINNIIYKFRNEPKCSICQDCPNCRDCQNCQDIHTQNCPNCQNCSICQNHSPIQIAEDLEKHSWSHWFRQPEHTPLSIVDKVVNSWSSNDYALVWMKRWNVLCHGEFNHYNRTHADYRTPEKNSLPEFAALLKPNLRVDNSDNSFSGILLNILNLSWIQLSQIWDNETISLDDATDIFLGYKDNLTDPIGLTNIVNNSNIDFLLSPSELHGDTAYFIDYDATLDGWDENNHSEMKDCPFYQIHIWYQKILKIHTHIVQ